MSIVGIADCTSLKGTYTTELYSTRNDRLLFRQIRPERDPFVAIINGSYAWSIDPITHQVESLDIKSIAMIQGHDFLMFPFILAQRLKNLKLNILQPLLENNAQKSVRLINWICRAIFILTQIPTD